MNQHNIPTTQYNPTLKMEYIFANFTLFLNSSKYSSPHTAKLAQKYIFCSPRLALRAHPHVWILYKWNIDQRSSCCWGEAMAKWQFNRNECLISILLHFLLQIFRVVIHWSISNPNSATTIVHRHFQCILLRVDKQFSPHMIKNFVPPFTWLTQSKKNILDIQFAIDCIMIII